MTDTPGFATRALHAGLEPDLLLGAVVPPIHQSSTYVMDGVAQLRGEFEYGRSGNPTRSVLEAQVAALEGATQAIAFASGMAAEDALLRALLRPGDRVLLGLDAYGGTHRLVADLYAAIGVRLDTVDLTDADAVRDSLALPARVVWIETPSNPLLQIVDIEAVASCGRAAGAVVVVDNTFASPALQQPLTLGADVVVHSATKYLGGHSDLVAGLVVTSDATLAEQVRAVQFGAGAILAPFEAWLAIRGIKTLAVRMRQHAENAGALAEWLSGHPGVRTVCYPGLPDHPGHALAARQMRGFGGMVTVALRGGEPAARAVAESTRLFALAESLGGVESLLCHPSSMTHASVRDTPLAIAGDVLRLSVGIEDVADLQADLAEALDRVRVTTGV